MEAIIKAAPPTTAYNKTVLLDSYQAALQQTAASFPLPTQAPATAPAGGASVSAPGRRHLSQYAGIATPRTVFDRDTYMVSPHCEVGRPLMWLASGSLQVTSGHFSATSGVQHHFSPGSAPGAYQMQACSNHTTQKPQVLGTPAQACRVWETRTHVWPGGLACFEDTHALCLQGRPLRWRHTRRRLVLVANCSNLTAPCCAEAVRENGGYHQSGSSDHSLQQDGPAGLISGGSAGCCSVLPQPPDCSPVAGHVAR